MRRRVKNSIYDTNKAKILGRKAFRSANDPAYYVEHLQMTKAGNYFLYGKGNEASVYSRLENGIRYGTEMITPVTYEEAYEWASTYLDEEETAKIFAEPEPLRQVSVYLPLSAKDKLNAAAEANGISYGAVIQMLIERYL